MVQVIYLHQQCAGALVRGLNLEDSTKLAVDYTLEAMKETLKIRIITGMGLILKAQFYAG